MWLNYLFKKTTLDTNNIDVFMSYSHAPVWVELALAAHAEADVPAGRRQHQWPVLTYRPGPAPAGQHWSGASRPKGQRRWYVQI